jgi:hypothetical protein
MKFLLAVVVAVIIIVVLGKCANASPCFSSAGEVLARHHRHATWNYVDGQRCWHAGYPGRHARRAYGMAFAIPLPRSRPDLEILHPAAYPRLSPQDGRRLADQLLGQIFRFGVR